jgi:hypothetical protein
MSNEDLNAVITHLQQQINELKTTHASRTFGDLLEYPESVRNAMPLFLQADALAERDRKSIINRYLDAGLPKFPRDENGLAAKVITDQTERRWLLTELPKTARESLDVARIAAYGWAVSEDLQGEQRADHLLRVVQDVLAIAMDNAQKIAQNQIKQVFKAAGAEGALSFVKESDPDLSGANIIQQSHIQAIADYRKMAGIVSPNRHNGNRPNGGGRGGKGAGRAGFTYKGKGGGKGNRWNGGKGGSWNNGGSNWRNQNTNSYGNSYGNKNHSNNDNNNNDKP